ncbi:hypothetical protein ACIA49_06335 [Kribbella sp. NPDC051587]|uniref:hypothetical protein n=1 Tax=Kribbella sp. NPDC051587 TaxID=3364119 RepID=UPI0037AC3A7B
MHRTLTYILSVAALSTAAAGLAGTASAAPASTGLTFCDFTVRADQTPAYFQADASSKVVAVSAAGRVVQLNAAARNGFLVGAFSPEYTYGWIRQSAVQVVDGSCKTY